MDGAIKRQEIWGAINVILNDIDTRPRTRKLFYELIKYMQDIFVEEEEE